jgi:hypothetical protein
MPRSPRPENSNPRSATEPPPTCGGGVLCVVVGDCTVVFVIAVVSWSLQDHIVMSETSVDGNNNINNKQKLLISTTLYLWGNVLC